MIKMNKKMENFVKKVQIKKKINIEFICEEIVNNTQRINDFILYGADNSLENIQMNWDRLLILYGDKTNYEVSNNELLLDLSIFSEECIYNFVTTLKSKLELKFQIKNMCVILSYSNRGILRFHIYRESEGMWLSEELEKYDEPILFCI